MLQALAPAKLNLYLHLTGKREDGYHTLLTHVVFTAFGDVLTFEESDLLTLHVEGPFAEECREGENLVLRAARLLQAYTGCTTGARITLDKRIPVGAGLGGGSSDAAATLRALNDFWALDLDFQTLLGLGLQLGADVPMCLYGRPLFASGVGEEIAVHEWPDGQRVTLWLVLVYPRVKLLTAQVFAMLTEEEVMRGHFALSHGYGEPLVRTRNDLQRAAIAAAPIVAEVLLAMETVMPGEPLLVRMTGSGSCCYALFKEEETAQRYAERLQQQYADWWVQLTQAES